MKCLICKTQYWEHTEGKLQSCLRQANLRLEDIQKIVKKLRVLY